MRASEKAGGKGAFVGDAEKSEKEKKSTENNRQPATLCARYVDAPDKEPIRFFCLCRENQYLHKITTGL